jgi:hypothetical protein
MNVLTPEIQTELLKAARRTPVCLLFAGDNTKAKALAAEVLAVHYDLYLFRVDLRRLLAQHPSAAEVHLDRIFSRAAEAGDMLCFEGADTLFSGDDEAARIFFLYQLQRGKGVIIVSVSSEACLDARTKEYFGSVIRFPAATAG